MASVLWRSGGQLYLTAIAKASFGFTLDGEVRCIAPEPIRRHDECARGLPSLQGAAEIAPRSGLVDVVLVGHAYAPPGTTHTEVRLALIGEQALIDKRLRIVGNRRQGGAAAPFERMRIGYERALGGLSFAHNPLGVGADGHGDVLPNVLDPTDPDGRVAGFGPIPASFPSRRTLRGKLDPRAASHSIVDYPPGFCWGFFQAAPADQRLAELRGDEWLELHGLHPRKARLRTQLARARALGRIYARRDVGVPSAIPLEADILHIEPDHNRLSIVYRGNITVASELAASELIIAGALALPGRTVQWPTSFAEIEPLASRAIDPSSLAGARTDDLQATAIPSSPGAHRTPTPPPAMISSPAWVASPPPTAEWETTAEMDDDDHLRAEEAPKREP